ncbi:SGNH/GDSL hydrolase family protein [Nocardia sp. NRRL S-836]|uniref:SGNH/GDSL hydrolase family protein n=1 Tax=Nocardia sp. NRRL S-836 TaxID=1519492 RepID=UPI0006AF9BC8|nr:SGNH/GDSL hydrolase family protein [Nocardia sp. NRRL S-836]KOV86337.1 GDSL family lipase [Nocardia sp. NRRL S-836]
MTITLDSGSRVMFTGDSITSLWRPPGGDRAAYPLQVAGRWCFEHPDRPMTWLNTGYPGDTVADLEARWQAEVLDARPDVLSILVGINDVDLPAMVPGAGRAPVREFAATYERLLAPLTGTPLILVEPFLLPVEGVIERELHLDTGPHRVRIGPDERERWRAGLDPHIEVVHELAARHGAELLTADRLFAELGEPDRWSDDGIHPTPAGHSALAEAWLNLVA